MMAIPSLSICPAGHSAITFVIGDDGDEAISLLRLARDIAGAA